MKKTQKQQNEATNQSRTHERIGWLIEYIHCGNMDCLTYKQQVFLERVLWIIHDMPILEAFIDTKLEEYK